MKYRYLLIAAALPMGFSIPSHSADSVPNERSNVVDTLTPEQRAGTINPEFVSQMQARIDRIKSNTNRLSSEISRSRPSNVRKLQTSVENVQRQALNAETELEDLKAAGGAKREKQRLNSAMQHLENSYADVQQQARESGIDLAE